VILSRGLSRIDPTGSHAVVVRPPAAFGRDPGDDLVGVGDVAGFAVDAVGGIEADAFAVGLSGGVEHFVDVGGTEILAGLPYSFTQRVLQILVS